MLKEFLCIDDRDYALTHVGPCAPGLLHLTTGEPLPILGGKTH
jgi:hypothetical protein